MWLNRWIEPFVVRMEAAAARSEAAAAQGKIENDRFVTAVRELRDLASTGPAWFATLTDTIGRIGPEVTALERFREDMQKRLDRSVRAAAEETMREIRQRDEALREALRQAEHWRGVAMGTLEADFERKHSKNGKPAPKSRG